MSAPPDLALHGLASGGALSLTAGAMDEIETTDQQTDSYASIQRRYNTHRRNIQILQQRIADYAGDAPLEFHNRLAAEKQKIAPLRDLLGEPAMDSLDDFDTTEQNGLILARLRRVEQRQQAREAQAEEDWKNRQQRQAEQDRFFFQIRFIGYSILFLFLVIAGLLIALLTVLTRG